MQKIKGAIFDLDGTLLDSMYIWDTVGEVYLRSIGYEPKKDLNEKFKSLSLYQAAQLYQDEYGVSLPIEELMNGINKAVEGFYFNDVLPKPGIRELLEVLHSRGVKMCIATATDRYQVEAALQRCGIDVYFSAIFTCSEIGEGKDKPTIYREALRHLATEKSETVVFEDAAYAIKTAKIDGFKTVAIFDTHENMQDEVKRFADYYISETAKVCKALHLNK